MFESGTALEAALLKRSTSAASRLQLEGTPDPEGGRSEHRRSLRADFGLFTNVELDWDAFLRACRPKRRDLLEELASMLPGPELASLLTDLTSRIEHDRLPEFEREGGNQGLDGVVTDAVHAHSGEAAGSSASEIDGRLNGAYAAVEMVAAWERVAAWAKAQAASAAARAAQTPELNPIWPATAKDVTVQSVAGEELAMRIGCSRMAARELISLGQAFEGPLSPTGDAMARGEIDLPKARTILKHLENSPGQTAWGVQEVVLAGAATRTPTQLAGDLQRALIAIDPEEAETRRQRAVETRRVCRPRALPDGMAGIWAVLPAPHAVQVDSGLDSLARSLRSSGDARTLDQLRADIFANTLLHQQLLEQRPDTTTAAPRAELGKAPRPLGSLPTHASAASAASAANDNADNASGARSDSGSGGSDDGASGAAEVVCGVRNGRSAGARVVVNVTVPLSTLLGVDDQPGELDGYGAITAHAARELAVEGEWRRIVTDPLTGSALDVGRTRYRPPASLVDHIRERDRVCARPGCSARAASCDLDHTIEFTREDGITAHTNLGPLCPRDHQIKTDGGFELTQPEPGVFDWRTPTGHTYRVWPGDHGRYEMTGRPPQAGADRGQTRANSRDDEPDRMRGATGASGSDKQPPEVPGRLPDDDPPPF